MPNTKLGAVAKRSAKGQIAETTAETKKAAEESSA